MTYLMYRFPVVDLPGSMYVGINIYNIEFQINYCAVKCQVFLPIKQSYHLQQTLL